MAVATMATKYSLLCMAWLSQTSAVVRMYSGVSSYISSIECNVRSMYRVWKSLLSALFVMLL